MIPLVLVPGMMCDARMWGEAAAGLGRPVQHVLPVGAETMDALADALLAKAPPRFALAGLSMGGIVAMAVLARAPNRVERVALLDTNPFAETPAVADRRAAQIARAEAGDLAGLMEEMMIPRYFASSDPDGAALCLVMALDLGPAVFRQQSLALRDRPDRTAALAAWTGPALVLTGATDRLCPMDRHAAMHALMPRSRLVVVPEAGHIPTLEQPAATRTALREWLDA